MSPASQMPPRPDPIANAATALEGQGWAVTRRPPSTYALEDVQNDLLRYLDDFKQQRFTFARYKDQLLDVEREGRRFECFGDSPFGPLLIDAHGAVHVLVLAAAGFDDDAQGEMRPVNSDFTAFVTSYCTFVSMLFELRARCTLLIEDELRSETTSRFEDELRERLVAIDETAHAADGMWPTLAYALGDGLFYIAAATHDFAADKRFSLIGDAEGMPGTAAQHRLTDRRHRTPGS